MLFKESRLAILKYSSEKREEYLPAALNDVVELKFKIKKGPLKSMPGLISAVR